SRLVSESSTMRTLAGSIVMQFSRHVGPRRAAKEHSANRVTSLRVPCFRDWFAKPGKLRISPRKHESLEGSTCFRGVRRQYQAQPKRPESMAPATKLGKLLSTRF